jgi:hypothetical protein
MMLDWVRRVTGAREAERAERVQSLWGGYGEVLRVRLRGADVPSVIVKWIEPPPGRDRSHARKLRSYAVERAWYGGLAARCDPSCRVPRCWAAEPTDRGWRFLLEDLDAAGFPGRREQLGKVELDACLRWLACFHARFLGEAPEGLWETGTYWHLATRPDELAALHEPALREAAAAIDARLASAAHQSLVHGDAKPANFCFAPDGRDVACVDFQYVGPGCGVKDVSYFLFGATGWGRSEPGEAPLDRYFTHLRAALAARSDVDAAAVEREWRALYPLARADFLRFYAGWAPSPRSIEQYRRALRHLG